MSKTRSARLLSLGVSATMVGFGVNQMVCPGRWTRYVPETIAQLLPISRSTVIRTHSLGNISLGLLLVTAYRSRLVWLMNGGWWANVTLLCGKTDWRAGVRDAAILSAIVSMLLVQDNELR